MSRAGGCFTVNLSLVKLYISSERNVAIMASPAIVNQRFHTSAHSYSALSICAIDLRSYFALSVLHCRNYCTFGKYSLENFLQPVVKSSNFYSCRQTHFLLSDTHIFPPNKRYFSAIDLFFTYFCDLSRYIECRKLTSTGPVH